MDAATILLQLVLSGILVGSVYGLTGMGFVITYRSANVFNLAYGQFVMFGAFIAWSFIGSPQEPRFPLPIALILTLIAVILFGLAVEQLLFRRMIGRPMHATFILTLGIMALLHGVAMLIWGPDIHVLAETIPRGPIHLGSIVVSQEYVWSFFLAVFIALILALMFQRTRLGLAMRAAYDNQVAARCLGVSVRKNAQITWGLAAVIATLGGILIGTVNGVSTNLGELVMIVLAVVLIGGLDSLIGCVLGGLILAIGMNLSSYYVGPHLPGVEGIFSMALILIVLLVRPSGLLGTRPIERV
jgi:branched-chain amino acid transport system permease protein